MHRRGIVLLFGFLVAIVVGGGGGVRAPWLPTPEAPAAQTSVSPEPVRIGVVQSRMRAE